MYDKTQIPIVSIIVPIYNTEKYLEQCLNSLQTQTLQNIEIIMIDDGSTDDSGNICNAFAADDKRFKVIHKENMGLSAARNDGLDNALGKYIMFVDSDDWVNPDYCEVPYNTMKTTGADLVVFQYTRHGSKISNKQSIFPNEGIADKKEVMTSLWHLTGVNVWNKMYHRKLFEGIRFPVGHLSEDTAVMHQLIYNSTNIYLLNRSLYHYRVFRPGSITNDRFNELIVDYFTFCFRRVEDLKRWGYDSKEAEEKYAFLYLVTMGRNEELSSHCEKILREADNFPYKTASRKQRIMYLVYRASPRLFDYISILSGRRIK